MREKIHFENNRNMNIPLIGFFEVISLNKTKARTFREILKLFPLKRFYGTEFKKR